MQEQRNGTEGRNRFCTLLKNYFSIVFIKVSSHKMHTTYAKSIQIELRSTTSTISRKSMHNKATRKKSLST